VFGGEHISTAVIPKRNSPSDVHALFDATLR
jgi:hypothetical protein